MVTRRTPTRHWPVAAWIKLKLPPRPPPLALAGPPPPLDPPLDLLQREPVATDPRKQIYAWEAPYSGGALRIVWDSDDPDVLDAEYRTPEYIGRLRAEEVSAFWTAVKKLVAVLGPLPVLGADPRP